MSSSVVLKHSQIIFKDYFTELGDYGQTDNLHLKELVYFEFSVLSASLTVEFCADNYATFGYAWEKSPIKQPDLPVTC